MSTQLSDAEADLLLELARNTLVSQATGELQGDLAAHYASCPALQKELACFVTLRSCGDLRGCMGSIEPSGPLWQAVQRNTINACSQDPRFDAVKPEELEAIHLDITVLSPTSPLESIDAIEPGKHGVMLQKNGRRAVFLPQVATEFGWTRDEMLMQLCRKAGLKPDAWQEGATLSVFEGVEYMEVPDE